MIVSPPIQLNNNSKEFIISRLRPFCFPIKAPITRKNNYTCQINLNGKINTYTHTHTSVSTCMPNRRRILSNVSSLAPQTDILSAHYAWHFSSSYDTCSIITLHPIQPFYISILNVQKKCNMFSLIHFNNMLVPQQDLLYNKHLLTYSMVQSPS